MISASHQAKLKDYISSAVRSGASDLHFSVGTAPVIRVDQRLQALSDDVIVTTEFVQNIAVYLAGIDGLEVVPKSELFFSVTLEAGIRVKVTIFFQKGLPAVTIKFIPGQIKPLEQLELPQSVSKLIEFKHGLVIISGPYGSGKSSTTAALVQKINSQSREYIITLENPIERIFNSQLSVIEQREIGHDTASMEKALEHLKHEDVDVVVISGFDSPACILLALEIASARALVIVTLDGNSVVNTLQKIVTSFSKEKQELVRRMLAEVLRGVLVQRLLPRIGGGTVPAVELLFSTSVVKELIKKNKIDNIDNFLTTSASNQMISLNSSLASLVKKKIISQADAAGESSNPDMFTRSLNIR